MDALTTRPMSEDEFAEHLNVLVNAALQGGVRFGDVVHTLEFAKSDVIELCRAQNAAAALEARPKIVTPGQSGLGNGAGN